MAYKFNDLKLKRKDFDSQHSEIWWERLGFKKIDREVCLTGEQNDEKKDE